MKHFHTRALDSRNEKEQETQRVMRNTLAALCCALTSRIYSFRKAVKYDKCKRANQQLSYIDKNNNISSSGKQKKNASCRAIPESEMQWGEKKKKYLTAAANDNR